MCQQSAGTIEACIEDIRKWMRDNRLVLNEAKTEIIHFHSKYKDFTRLESLSVGDTVVKTSKSVRDLGFYFDDILDFKVHVGHICKSVSYALYRIGRIRNLLDQTSTERLIHAFVTSRLDYCNSMLHNLPVYLTNRLQLLQNSVARLITLSKNTSTSPLSYTIFTGSLFTNALNLKFYSSHTKSCMIEHQAISLT